MRLWLGGMFCRRQHGHHVAELNKVLKCYTCAAAPVSLSRRCPGVSVPSCSRVDDPVGVLAMTLVFVASMTAIMLVNVADIILLLRAAAHGGDDPSGGGGDDPSGDEGGGSGAGRRNATAVALVGRIMSRTANRVVL